MKITTILPVSRTYYLDRVLDCLLNQTVEIENLIVVFDGPDEDFIQVRNRIAGLYIENKICVKSTNRSSASTIVERRWHISNIHNQIRELLEDCDWVFSVEDDGVIPENALERLIEVVKDKPDVGMVTGVELGRWGIPYVGAWKADNTDRPYQLTSLSNSTHEPFIEEIDACGLYCALIRADKYKEHEFNKERGLGPDVNLGLFMRSEGLQNYIDWGIKVTHLTNYKGREIEIPADSKSEIASIRLISGSTWKQ